MNDITPSTTAPDNITITMDEDERLIADLACKRETSYCSLTATDETTKAILYTAMNNPSHRTSECANMIINVKDVFVEAVHLVNKESGEVGVCPRVVLIDDKGEGYQSVSIGIYSALRKIFTVFGAPTTWKKPLPVTVKVITRGENKIYTLDVVMNSKK